MPMYMFQAKYTSDAFKAMLAEPQDRTAAGEKIVEAHDGKLRGLYFAMGEYDIVAMVEAADDETMGAIVMTLAASGAFSGGMTTKLIPAPEAKAIMQAAAAKAGDYTPVTG